MTDCLLPDAEPRFRPFALHLPERPNPTIADIVRMDKLSRAFLCRNPSARVPRSFTVFEPDTPLPAVMISYPTTPASDPDAVTLQVLYCQSNDNLSAFAALMRLFVPMRP